MLIENYDHANATLRGAVEWYKGFLREATEPTPEERAYADQQWTAIVTRLAELHQLPPGFLSYVLAGLAQQEHTLVVTATTEAAEAGVEVAENFGASS